MITRECNFSVPTGINYYLVIKLEIDENDLDFIILNTRHKHCKNDFIDILNSGRVPYYTKSEYVDEPIFSTISATKSQCDRFNKCVQDILKFICLNDVLTKAIR
jgi:hypothetical protein